MEKYNFLIWVTSGFLSYAFNAFYLAKLASQDQLRRQHKIASKMHGKLGLLKIHLVRPRQRWPARIWQMVVDLLDVIRYYFFVFKWRNPVGQMDTMYFLIAGGYVMGLDYVKILCLLLNALKLINQIC